jgi:hypothetical protein
MQREPGGVQVESAGRESMLFFFSAFKTHTNQWERQTQEIPIQ